MAMKPWETKLKEGKEELARKSKGLALISTSWLTILLSLFFIMVLAILFVVFYTSSGGSDKATATSGFSTTATVASSAADGQVTDANAATTVAAESTVDPAATTEAVMTDAVTSAPTGGTGATVVVLAGEGAASIAARAGISLETLYALNPGKMIGPGGTWWANPGDVVYID